MKKALVYITLSLIIISIILVKYKSDYYSPELSKSASSQVVPGIREIRKGNFVFPRDHASHNDFRTEWWYFSGNMSDPDGKKFGYEFTVFRKRISFNSQGDTAGSRADNMYLAHFALTDAAGGKFHYKAKYTDGSVNDAGSSANPFKVWVHDCSVTANYNKGDYLKPDFNLNASAPGYSAELILHSLKDLVPEGDNGISRKGSGKDEYSNYYSITRLSANGTIKIGDNKYTVSGTSWLDREWSNLDLSEPSIISWDWFSIQLDNDCELMFYNIRNTDNSAGRYSSGNLIYKDGRTEKLTGSDLRIGILGYWESDTHRVYPSGWKMSIPKHAISLTILPLLKDQELQFSVDYWEGAVNVKGTYLGKEISGRGYVELTGY